MSFDFPIFCNVEKALGLAKTRGPGFYVALFTGSDISILTV